MSEKKSTSEKVAKRLADQKVTVVREGFVGTHDSRLERGFCYVTGRIESAGRAVLPAVLHTSVKDGEEHCGTMVPVNGKLVHVHKE